MKHVIKKQCKSVQHAFKGLLLLVILSGLGAAAFAQGAEVCAGTAYTIANTEDASVGATYQWLENGKLIPNASAAAYTVPSNKVAGLYTYIRQAKSADCEVWQSSNEFAVTVFNCSFTAGTATSATATFVDPRDGKSYKTVVMPDGKTWFAQNLNYTKDLMYNAYSYEANGKQFTSATNGVPAIGSYWCPPAVNGSVVSGTEADCRTYGALYTWETAMMVDGKYADEEKTSSVWDESWVSPYYFNPDAVPSTMPEADRNNARGGTDVKSGGRGICPKGWHVPTVLEWAYLLDKVDGDGSGTTFSNQYTAGTYTGVDVGKKLKSAATYTGDDPGDGSWKYHNELTIGSNLYAFNAYPSGYVWRLMEGYSGRGAIAYFTSSTVCEFGTQPVTLSRLSNGAQYTPSARATAGSVRCVRNQ